MKAVSIATNLNIRSNSFTFWAGAGEDLKRAFNKNYTEDSFVSAIMVVMRELYINVLLVLFLPALRPMVESERGVLIIIICTV